MLRFLCTLLVALALKHVSADCVTNPTDPICKAYSYPVDLCQKNADMMCCAMPNMDGCTFRKQCAKQASDPFCQPFVVLKLLCTDMPKMHGCANFTQLCAAGSVVDQCNTPVPHVPGTMQTGDLIVSVCNSMPMDGCSTCNISASVQAHAYLPCDMLGVYSDLCVQMPDMDECVAWKAMCKDIPKWSLCTGN
eukprot:TRINITY_DN1601_c0_g1_i1.p1 TRINITY_DN1601_c0_g1~~TRINITY_DN1601_c0_g1_i1.p1  ORF type:complete len:192 (-),score=22.17 TRINITY_DN1601_c0_g1_i1:100-675(-)